MYKFISILIITLTITSCGVQQSEYDSVMLENEKLLKEIEKVVKEKEQVQSSYDKLISEIKELEEKKVKATEYTDEDALKLLADYYDFYNADKVYRNTRVRKLSDNEFRISLEECTKKGSFSDNDFFWHSYVKLVTIYSDGKYDVTNEAH